MHLKQLRISSDDRHESNDEAEFAFFCLPSFPQAGKVNIKRLPIGFAVGLGFLQYRAVQDVRPHVSVGAAREIACGRVAVSSVDDCAP